MWKLACQPPVASPSPSRTVSRGFGRWNRRPEAVFTGRSTVNARFGRVDFECIAPSVFDVDAPTNPARAESARCGRQVQNTKKFRFPLERRIAVLPMCSSPREIPVGPEIWSPGREGAFGIRPAPPSVSPTPVKRNTTLHVIQTANPPGGRRRKRPPSESGKKTDSKKSGIEKRKVVFLIVNCLSCIRVFKLGSSFNFTLTQRKRCR